ncbi:MAG: hypothetical protein GQ574_02560 [Crocinitomix sp.]|nr:hypothetical protein [Crocinitomix sp.]
MSIYKEFAQALLPDGILDYCDLTDFKKKGNALLIFLEEKPVIPSEYKDESYRLNGFMPEVTIKDFPIREFKAELKIKRRRWLLTGSNTKVTGNWDLLSPGTRMTKGFADFLKELAKY